jgi:hypothetical protein
MEIGYILMAIMGYAVAPYIYEVFLSLFFGWQYRRYMKKTNGKPEDSPQ